MNRVFNILKCINIRIYYCVCKWLKTSILTFLVEIKIVKFIA